MINKYDFKILIWGVYEMKMPGSECPDVGPLKKSLLKQKFQGASDAVGGWKQPTRVKYNFLSPVFFSKVSLQTHLTTLTTTSLHTSANDILAGFLGAPYTFQSHLLTYEASLCICSLK